MLNNRNSFNVNEEEFDENGRPISGSYSNVQTTFNFDNEEEFDENGRPISGSYSNVQTTSNFDNEEEFDENGRTITKDSLVQNESLTKASSYEIYKEEKVDYTNYNKIENIEETSILFAKLDKNNRFLTSINEWVLDNSDDNYGIFFIKNPTENISKMTIELTNESGDLLWESEIRDLPSNTFVLNKTATYNTYISKKVLRPEDLLAGDNIYYFNIRELDTDNVFFLDVIDNRHTSNQNDIEVSFDIDKIVEIDDENDIQEDSLESSSEKVIDKILKYETFNEEDDLLECNNDTLNENLNNDNDYDCIEAPFPKGYTERLLEDLEIPSYEVLIDTCSRKNIKSKIIDKILNYAPVNIDYRTNETVTKIMYSLVIEKVDNYYVAILNGFMNRPIYILNGEERYFEFDGTTSEFIDKIKTIVCNMYSMTSVEFENLTKLVILDEIIDNEIGEQNKSIKFTSRREIFDSIVPSNSNLIIDLLNNSCNLVFSDEENKTLKIVCEGLGLHNKETTLEVISSLINTIRHDNIILTGLFINNNITVDHMNLDKECNIDALSKYVSI